MKLILTIHYKDSFSEIFLPNINNKRVPIEINSSVSGFSSNLMLNLEVWDEEWFLIKDNKLNFFIKGIKQEKIKLAPDMLINGLMIYENQEFSMIVEEVISSLTEFRKYYLPTSSVTIGCLASNSIYFNHRFVSSNHAVIETIRQGEHVVKDLQSKNGTYVNGNRITSPYTLRIGDVIFILGLKIIYLGRVLAVNNPGGLVTVNELKQLTIKPSAPHKDFDKPLRSKYYFRSPRQIVHLDKEPLEIEAPPNPNHQRQQPLFFTIGPAFTMIIPMAIGLMFMLASSQSAGMSSSPYLFMGIITSGTAAFIGVFWSLANHRHSKKTNIQDEKLRNEAYKRYLERIRNIISEKQHNNAEKLELLYPNANECVKWGEGSNHRLWERNVNHTDFLTLRLGIGDMNSPNTVIVPKEKFTLIDDNLALEPARIQHEFRHLRRVPVCISLIQQSLIGVISTERNKVIDIARTLTVQIASQHCYTDVRMVFLYSAKEAQEWGFAKWLPHVWSPDGKLRMLACDDVSTSEVLYTLSNTIRERQQEDNRSNIPSRILPHYVVFIADSALVEQEAIMKQLLSPTIEIGFTTILLYDRLDRLPNNCTVIIQNDPAYSGYYSLDESFEENSGVEFDKVQKDAIDDFTRNLSGRRVRELNLGGMIPQTVSFLEMYNTSKVEDLDVYRMWLENRTYESMKALVGYRGGGAPLYLDIHEKHHGPHGLVAGTTGSGKSETLQTYILSLAVNYHPYEVSFILIDYKGGGMAGSFKGLPHIAGIITNLGGNQTNRALISINSEIKRRQAIFSELDIKHIDMHVELYRSGKAKEPMPHLIIIADEFAELKKEQPEFVRELVSASRVGRSLGVHLILATQKPSGVVDEEIWGNSKFRLCLRVQDKQDSNEMLRRTDAAYITNAGRGFFQVGNDEIFEEFQSGWSGARYMPEKVIKDDKTAQLKMINLWGKPCVITTSRKAAPLSNSAGPIVEEQKVTQLEAVVQYIHRIAESKSIKAIDNIWLPPLPQCLYLDDMHEFKILSTQSPGNYLEEDWELKPILGLGDDPVNQRQMPLEIRFVRDGHLLIAGSTSSGKSTCLQTMLYSIVTLYSPNQVNIYIADFGSRTLGVFDRLPHVGGVVFDNDLDKVDKLFNMFVKELTARKLLFSAKGIGSYKEYIRVAHDVPALMLMIDNYPSFIENCSKHEDDLILLAREAASYGIYLVLTCSNASDIRGKIRQNFSNALGLQLADRFSYEDTLGERLEMVADAQTPGRGLCKYPKPIEFQTALCMQSDDAIALNITLRERFDAISEQWRSKRAREIPQVPKDMSWECYQDLESVRQAIQDPNELPIGYDMDEAVLKSLNLKNAFCFMIGGQDRSGKTNLMKVFMKEAKMKKSTVCLIDNPAKDLSSFSKALEADAYLTNADEVHAYFLNTIIPEFKKRSNTRADFLKQGKITYEEYLATHQDLYIFIHDLGSFCELVYSSEKDIKSFLELMLVKGDQHRIFIIACVTQSHYSMHNLRLVMKNFTAWKTGIHFGGFVDQQRLLDFDLPISERSKRMQPGIGLIQLDETTRKVIVPYL